MITQEERMEQLRLARIPKPKKEKKPLRQKSLKKQEEEKELKELRNGDDTLMENWFKARRKEMTGTCSCGCGEPSQKKDEMYFRHCICHIFPKAKFLSVMYHPKNWVELKFWGGHHTNFDEGGMDKWPNMACWERIKEAFYELAPLLTQEELATKFYHNLEKLIYAN